MHLAQEKELLARNLVQTAKLAEIGLAFAEVVHELRQPLASISGYAQLIEISALPADAANHLKEILEQSARMECMLDRLRRFLKVDNQEDLVADVRSAVQGTISLFPSMPPGVSLETEISSSLPSVIGSYHSLVQILTNLLTNARDAQANFGPGIIRIQAQWSGQQVSILVADQGAGVDPTIVTQLFQPFVSTKGERGTGLGLYISREIVSGWKGTLRLVENPPALFRTAFELGLQPVAK